MSINYNLTPSLEDYLEVIWDLEGVNTVARVKDISDTLGVKRSSVTIALRSLGKKELINYAPYSVITLTDEGKRIGGNIRRKHNLLRNFFTNILGIDIEVANDAACLMEHGLLSSIQYTMEAFVQALYDNDDIRTKLIEDMDKIISDNDRTDTPLPLLVSLNKLKTGDSGIINRLIGSNDIKTRLFDMGLTPNISIKILSVNSNNEIEVEVEKFRLSLNLEEASLVLVEQ